MTSDEITLFRQRYATHMKALRESVAESMGSAEVLFHAWVERGVQEAQAGNIGQKILYCCAVAGLMKAMIETIDQQQAERN